MTSTFNSFRTVVRPTNAGVSVLLACVVLVLAASGASAATCKRIAFEEVRLDIGPHAGVGVARIVVQPADTTWANLLCLEKQLRSAHREWSNVTALVFSSKVAADNFDPDKIATVGVVGAYDRQVRAAYWIGTGKIGDTLTLTPSGWELLQGEDYNTVVVFPVQHTPPCRIVVNRRCVLTLERIRYPLEALRGRASGTVIVSGRFDRQGRPTMVQPTASGANAPPQSRLLIESAVDIIRTWRLEPAATEERFRIDVTFSLDDSIRGASAVATTALQDRFRREGIAKVEFGTNSVKIRGALLE
jgi:TonB family protein